MQVEHLRGDGVGAFVVHRSGRRIGELTYLCQSGRVRIRHTWVEPTLRGQGAAGLLVRTAVHRAREERWAVVPECSYVRYAFRTHPEWSDVLADEV